MNFTQDAWQDLVDGRRDYCGAISSCPLLFPGSFNPVHHGHRQMANLAGELLGRRIHLEISLVNVDKPPLDFAAIGQRLVQAQRLGPVVLTRTPRFVDKAKVFPDATFIIGADTAIRLDDPCYYDDDPKSRDRAIEQIADSGGRFLVFGRLVNHQFRDADALDLSPTLRTICQFVPKTQFRVDISSSQLRCED
ncbi:MAG: hypothetical protein HKN47_16140 [Pirellulaceae bacterium]|nr:hypothetical protein [Pirellulaceae bacterium]